MSAIVIPEYNYIHVAEPDGSVKLVAEPGTYHLKFGEQLMFQPKMMQIVDQGRYATIKNPYDATTKKIKSGEVETREGPLCFPLYPGEELKTLNNVRVLDSHSALIVEASQTFTDASGTVRRAGEQYRILGPRRYIPHECEQIQEEVKGVHLHEGKGLYVQNRNTSEVRLIEGPTLFIREPHEKLYKRRLDPEQCKAIGIESETSCDACRLQLSPGQMVCLIDFEGKERILAGPMSTLLGPQDEVKLLSLSAGKPKGSKFSKVGKVFVGPDFLSDKIQVSTKDNMDIELVLSYKWQLLINETTAINIFQTEDFVGIACRKLQGMIRNVAAELNFAEFQVDTVKHFRQKLFVESMNKALKHAFGDSMSVDGSKDAECIYLQDIHFLVTEIDVKEMEPVDKALKSQFNNELKDRMSIMVSRLQREAELELERYRQEMELNELEGRRMRLQKAIDEKKAEETLGRSRIDNQCQLKLDAEREKQNAQLKAKSNEIEVFNMKEQMELLKGEEGKLYVEYLRTKSLGTKPQNWIVPTTSTANLPLSQ
jgi:major vault protein